MGLVCRSPSGSTEQEERDVTLDAQLSFAIYKNANKVSRLYRHYLQPYGLTFPLYLVLVVLWEHAPCNVGRVLEALDLDTNTVTPLLKRLQALGYVSRERDTSDERKVTVRLTSQGEALRDVVMAIRTDFIGRSGVDYDAFVDMRTGLQRLSHIIDTLMPRTGAGSKAQSRRQKEK